MAQGITARGIAAEGSVSASVATDADVSLNAGASALVFVMSDGGDPDSVVWGTGGDAQAATKLLGGISDGVSGLTGSLWQLQYVLRTLTRDMVASWAATNSERLIAVVEVDEATVTDIAVISNTETGSTDPDTGVAGTSIDANTLQVCFFGSDGRISDALGTLGEGHTSLESGGTVAQGSHCHVTYELLTTAGGDVRGAKTGATSRNWINIIVALTKRQTFTVTKVEQRDWNQNHKPNYVWFTIEDESGAGFEEPMSPALFDELSDAQVTDWIRELCAIWTANNLDDDYQATGDATRDSRMSTFVLDEVVI